VRALAVVGVVGAALVLSASAFGACTKPKTSLAKLEGEVMCPTCHTTLDQSNSLAARRIERAEPGRATGDGEVHERLLDETQEQDEVIHQLRASDGLELGNDRVGDDAGRRIRDDGFHDSRERDALALADGHAGTAVLRFALSSAAS
jgi:uncharacterized Zn finger protein (UPF0148 family)